MDDPWRKGCGAIHAVRGGSAGIGKNKANQIGGGGAGGGVNGVVALVLVAVVLFSCLGGAVIGSQRGGHGQQRWPKLSLVGADSVGIIPTHKRP